MTVLLFGMFVCLGKISFVGCSNDGLSTTSFCHVDEDVNLANQSKNTLIVTHSQGDQNPILIVG